MAFGILLFPGVEELDFVGPWEMVAMWSSYAAGPKKLVTVAQKKGSLRCAKGLGVIADHDFSDCPPLDYLLVPGGFAVFDELENTELIDFIKQTSATAQHMLSVCSGAFLLHKAGLLHGKAATTHWKALEDFRDLPDVRVIEERWVRDGAIWTSGGVSAGIDMTLGFIADIAGAEAAGIVQMNAEYYPDDKVYGSAHAVETGAAYFNALKITDPA